MALSKKNNVYTLIKKYFIAKKNANRLLLTDQSGGC
jgi:hypothetical protein